jgi:hypothetical protein
VHERRGQKDVRQCILSTKKAHYNNYDFSRDILAESLARRESAFSEWTYCHPCVADDVENIDGTKYLPSDDDVGGATAKDDGNRGQHLGGIMRLRVTSLNATLMQNTPLSIR